MDIEELGNKINNGTDYFHANDLRPIIKEFDLIYNALGNAGEKNKKLQAELVEKQLLLNAHIVTNRQFQAENERLREAVEVSLSAMRENITYAKVKNEIVLAQAIPIAEQALKGVRNEI